MASSYTLVVDTDHDAAARMATRLERLLDAHRCIPVSNVAAAITYVLRDPPPRCLVVDANLSPISTDEFVKCIDRLDPTVPVVLTTESRNSRDGLNRSPTYVFGESEKDTQRLASWIAGALELNGHRSIDHFWQTHPAFMSGPDPMLVIDDDGTCVLANTAANELFDREDGDLVGRPLGSFVQSGLDFDQHWRGFCVGGRDRGILPIRSTDGTERQVEFAATLDVEPGRHLLIIRDITDRVRSERALEGLHEMSQRIMRADSPISIAQNAIEIAVDDLDFSIVGVWLYDSADTTLKPTAISEETLDLLPDSTPEFNPRDGAVWDAFTHGGIRIFEDADVSGAFDGTSVKSEMLLALGEHGIIAIGSVTEDLCSWTKVRLAQLLATNTETALDGVLHKNNIVERTIELERQNERLDTVASVLSHDLRNPLTVAKGHLEQLQDGEETDVGDHLKTIEKALDRMDELVTDVLTMAREGNTIRSTERVDLDAITMAAWETVDAPDAKLSVETPLGTVEADKSRLRTLFENLFRNSVDHGGSTVTIRVGSIEEGGFYVADDGPGIDPANRGEVFSFGYSQNEVSTGIGLSIVKSIAAAHGWAISVTESWAGGARFEFKY